MLVGWVGGVSILHNEPMSLDECLMFYTAWKMCLSATDCFYLAWLWGFCPQTSPGLCLCTLLDDSLQTLPPNSGYATEPGREGAYMTCLSACREHVLKSSVVHYRQ